MKKLSIIIVAVVFSICGCDTDSPSEIPVGTWEYDLLVNGVQLGSATISNKVEDNHYVYSFDLTMGNGQTQSNDVIVETLDCKPVKLEKHTYINAPAQQRLDIIAECNGKQITLTENNNKTVIVLDKDYILDGNYFLYQLIKNKFKEGRTIRHNVYDPSIEREDAIPVTITLVGKETIAINSIPYRAWRVDQSIGKIKNIIVYLDDKGVVLKTSISMLNMKLDVIRKGL
ncbi:MAG TPA: hypothetical protein PLH80_06495 [Spirochaetota bacterium]|nr:hypothetical protein [Spirochaetota bacterium]HQG42124.1 hypothetical protein [Spirochaetota bacterium]HQI38192.1 hypothetical protein [Spirochaetota bacterium]HQK07159.1 hypothetical protein [Spirochaetota bacterium]